MRKRDCLEQPADVEVVLLGQDFGRRHEGDLQAVLHRDERRHQRDDRLARSDVALQQPVHRLRPLHVGDDLADDGLLIAGQLERQHPPHRLADLVGDDDRAPLALGVGAAPAQHDPELEEEELLEDQPPVRRRSKRVQLGDRGVRGRESAPARARRAVRSAAAAARTAAGSGSGSCAGIACSAWCTSVRCIFAVSCPVFS